METRVAPQHEQLKTFDQLASIDMYRFDVQRFGKIQHETLDRVHDEELSLVAEGIDRASRTTFVLKRQGEDLVYFNRGEWQPYIGTLLTGLQTAKHDAEADPRKQFLAERAGDDLLDGYKLQSLQPGQMRVWYSAYPQQQEDLYGQEFVASLGFQPKRKMGFLYRAVCNEDGTVTLQSQSVDRNCQAGFAAATRMASYDQDADMLALTRAYDGALSNELGGYFFAGRRGAEVDENVWQQIQEHADLVGYFMESLEKLAGDDQLDRGQLEEATKRARYGFWAALQRRLSGETATPVSASGGYQPAYVAQLAMESHMALQIFARQGRVLSGCGGDVRIMQGEADIMSADGQDVFTAIFGNKEGYSFTKRMYCVVCQAPPEKKADKKWCGPCGLCGLCDIKARAKAA